MSTTPESSGGVPGAQVAKADVVSWLLCVKLAIVITAGTVVFTILSQKFARIFRDFEVELSLISRLVTHPLYWPSAWLVSAMVLAVVVMRMRRDQGVINAGTVRVTLTCLWGLYVVACMLGLFMPLMQLVTPKP